MKSRISTIATVNHQGQKAYFCSKSNFFNMFKSVRYSVFLMLFAALLVLSGCGNTGNQDNRLPTDLIQNPHTAEGVQDNLRLPDFEFEREFHDFGNMIEGEQVSFGFKFKNSGKADLLISNVRSSCGCTVPSFPQKPLKPGAEGVISVSFDSRGRRGVQVKTVTVIANTQPNNKLLTIRANIINPELMN
jgi:hypothetical protein